MASKKAQSDVLTIVRFAAFFVIIFLFIQAGLFSAILQVFNDPALGGLGILIGVLFIFMIILALLQRILGK